MVIDKGSVKGWIVNAAWKLFGEKGDDDTTVGDGSSERNADKISTTLYNVL